MISVPLPPTDSKYRRDCFAPFSIPATAVRTPVVLSRLRSSRCANVYSPGGARRSAPSVIIDGDQRQQESPPHAPPPVIFYRDRRRGITFFLPTAEQDLFTGRRGRPGMHPTRGDPSSHPIPGRRSSGGTRGGDARVRSGGQVRRLGLRIDGVRACPAQRNVFPASGVPYRCRRLRPKLSDPHTGREGKKSPDR